MPEMQIEFHRLAAKDYLQARRWYAQRSASAAASFTREVDEAVQHIASGPEQWPTFREKFRWVRVRRFPYVLYFHSVSATDVLVLAVAHARRRSGYWIRRASN